MAGRLADKVAIVTGAASGQGRVAAELFAREGALMILADMDREGLEQVGEHVRKSGGDPQLFEGNLTQEETNRAMVEATLSRHGRLDVLYNAAGLVRMGPLLETSLENWHFTLEHELTITFLGCKYAVSAMLRHGSGSIINISSGSGGVRGVPNHAAHAATKAGIVGLTRQIAVEYGPKGIRCNAIAPGFLVYQPGQRRVASQTRERSPEGIPLGRFTRPEDTAYCALYLASDESSYVTGQVLVVDGGNSVR
ncbi:MAG: SDR family oxidoreductase [Deltaproteobacteria bacterium]|nr:SDR family oxidoreductase [Deltaproteobacteria bacterium]